MKTSLNTRLPCPHYARHFGKKRPSCGIEMSIAARLNLSLSEETITECALYNIALAHQSGEIVIRLATKPAEARHGADWEWWLVRGSKGFGFRVQAKRLFPDGRYRALRKSGANGHEQLDKLVHVSKSTGLQALYCFFNFSCSHGQFNGPNLCRHRYRAPSFWGCSLAFPDQVKHKQSTKIAELERVMHPWHLLVCDSKTDLLASAANFVRDRGGQDDVSGPRDLPAADRAGGAKSRARSWLIFGR